MSVFQNKRINFPILTPIIFRDDQNFRPILVPKTGEMQILGLCYISIEISCSADHEYVWI